MSAQFPLYLALAWILKQSDLISILSGATAPEQVRENVAALNINLSDADATLMREMARRWSVKYSTRFTSVSVKTVMKICDSNRLF
ncbi:aldo/keto reductase [Escherichia coli]